jgi:hypothetical protein
VEGPSWAWVQTGVCVCGPCLMYWAGTASGASGALSKDEDCPAAQVGGAIASLTFGGFSAVGSKSERVVCATAGLGPLGSLLLDPLNTRTWRAWTPSPRRGLHRHSVILVYTNVCSEIVAKLGNMKVFTCVKMSVWCRNFCASHGPMIWVHRFYARRKFCAKHGPMPWVHRFCTSHGPRYWVHRSFCSRLGLVFGSSDRLKREARIRASCLCLHYHICLMI